MQARKGYMNYDLYSKIRKGNRKALEELQKKELPFGYFVCYRITGDTESAAVRQLRSAR